MDQTLIERLEKFLSNYYKEEIAKIAQHPNDRKSLWISHKNLYRFDPDIADDLRKDPDAILDYIEEALPLVDLPLDVDLSHVTVRVTDLDDTHVYSPGEIRKEQGGKFVGIHGILERVTNTSDLPETLVYQCQRCPTKTEVPQTPTEGELQEPHECRNCERQGPFKIVEDESEWSDYVKIRIDSRPDSDYEGKITGYVLNDLIDVGGDQGIIGRNGEPVTVYGEVKRVQKKSNKANNLLFDHHLKVNSIEFVRDDETVDVQEHKDEFMELANQPDAVDKFAESLAPNLHATDAWDTAFEFGVAYLFGSPRIDIPQGPTYRGDLHFLIVSDYGMGKSDFSTDIEAYSPKCISKSTTALSSGVGLTAAATKDDFGEGQWTLKPGLLVKANGGHLILDEIDKGPDELTDMNDALEGKQQVDVEKAGQSATYESRTGLMALGNPVEGRFDPHMKISEQLGISESLLSRFDGIVTMEDNADKDQDENVAESYGRAYTEAQQSEYGEEGELDYLDRPVGVDVGQAWVKYAREEVNPILQYEQFEELKDWYADDVRQLNKSFAGDGEGENMPVPATVRVLGAAVKMSIAFARVHLRDEVKEEDVERAKKLGKRLVKQNWNGERFDPPENKGDNPQKSRHKKITNECGGNVYTATEVSDITGIDRGAAEKDLKQMSNVETLSNNRYKIEEVHYND
jgi:replicative DNA helicase Mcm